jgi:hypothetical protein
LAIPDLNLIKQAKQVAWLGYLLDPGSACRGEANTALWYFSAKTAGELGSQGKALAKRPAAIISTARAGAEDALAGRGRSPGNN